MAVSLTPPNLVPGVALADADLMVAWPSAAGGPLQKYSWSLVKAQLSAQMGGTTFLLKTNNLSDVGNPTTARGNLGCGTAATADIGTSGNTVPLLNGVNTWSAIQTFSAGSIGLNNPTSNWVNLGSVGLGPPTFTARSAGTKLLAYASVDPTHVDFAMGVEATFLWFSAPQALAGQGFKFYAGQTLVGLLNGAGAWQWPAYTTPGYLQVDASGNVTATGFTSPTKPAFTVYLHTTVPAVTGDGTSYYPVKFDTASFDQAANFSIASGLFTVPVTGKYLFTANVTLNGVLASHTRCQLNLVINGSTIFGRECGALTPDTNTRTSANLDALLTLAAGGTVGVQLVVSNSTKVIGVFGDAGGVVSFFSAVLIT